MQAVNPSNTAARRPSAASFSINGEPAYKSTSRLPDGPSREQHGIGATVSAGPTLPQHIAENEDNPEIDSPYARVSIHLPDEEALRDFDERRRGPAPCDQLINWLRLLTGIPLKAGALIPSRWVASILTEAFVHSLDALPGQPDDSVHDQLKVLAAAGVVLGVTMWINRPAISAGLTFSHKDESGKTQVTRAGGSQHENLVRGLLVFTFLLGIGRGVGHALADDEAAQRDAGIVASMVDFMHMYLYATIRTFAEIPGARLMPARTIVDADGYEASADAAKSINKPWLRPLFMFLLAAPAAGGVAYSILNWPLEKTPDPLTGWANFTDASLVIGLYETLITCIDTAATAAAASVCGMSMVLGPAPERPKPEISADPIAQRLSVTERAPAREADALAEDPPVITEAQKAESIVFLKAAIENMLIDEPEVRCKSFWDLMHWLTPNAAVRSLRALINAPLLNTTFDSYSLAWLGSMWQGMPVAFHAVVLGIVESWVVCRLEMGLSAQAEEGQAPDQKLFDKLHVLCQTQDYLVQMLLGGVSSVASETPVLRRTISPFILHFIKDDPRFDDVRAHVNGVAASKHSGRDSSNAMLSFEPDYPTLEMLREFGSILAHEPMPENSPVKLQLPMSELASQSFDRLNLLKQQQASSAAAYRAQTMDLDFKHN